MGWVLKDLHPWNLRFPIGENQQLRLVMLVEWEMERHCVYWPHALRQTEGDWKLLGSMSHLRLLVSWLLSHHLWFFYSRVRKVSSLGIWASHQFMPYPKFLNKLGCQKTKLISTKYAGVWCFFRFTEWLVFYRSTKPLHLSLLIAWTNWKSRWKKSILSSLVSVWMNQMRSWQCHLHSGGAIAISHPLGMSTSFGFLKVFWTHNCNSWSPTGCYRTCRVEAQACRNPLHKYVYR